ncbi:MAG: PIN domain-containing protein [Nanoarchaeota archaeon]|nr:PIN domain-containing protein [Nanoarchaeota archaeon]
MFLFDTYALIEIIKGNKNYLPYINSKVILNTFIFSELCYVLIRDNYPNVDEYLIKYERFLVSMSPSLIREAMKFRYNNKKKKLSMTDCVSYIQAKELGVKFLTGDKEFEGMENVEFVKK